jgi:hypothetical protein
MLQNGIKNNFLIKNNHCELVKNQSPKLKNEKRNFIEKKE